MSKITFIGTGLLGSAFVEAALGRGDEVTVWNRTAARAEPLRSLGARVAESPADAVKGAERVHVVLKDDDSVEQVIAMFKDHLDPAAVIVDHTTTRPDRTAKRSRDYAASGVRYLHCPVFIGPAAARKGEGIILAAGRQDLYDVVRPALERQAQRVVYYGEEPGRAAAIKLAGNAFIVGIGGLIADALAVGRKGGASGDEILDALGWFNSANIVRGRGRNMVDDNFPPSFELAMARKDLQLMIETASVERLAMLPGLAARMDEMIALGFGSEDYSVVGKDSA